AWPEGKRAENKGARLRRTVDARRTSIRHTTSLNLRRRRIAARGTTAIDSRGRTPGIAVGKPGLLHPRHKASRYERSLFPRERSRPRPATNNGRSDSRIREARQAQ